MTATAMLEGTMDNHRAVVPNAGKEGSPGSIACTVGMVPS